LRRSDRRLQRLRPCRLQQALLVELEALDLELAFGREKIALHLDPPLDRIVGRLR
jgi:hypothetical protein